MIIDPATVIYAGFIGGSGNDYGVGIAVDSTGSAYVTGHTASTEATFPEVVGPDLTANGGFDAFVAKINIGGTALVYAGFIGGNSSDFGYGIAVDSTGNAFVTGEANSIEATFPEVGGPDLTANGGTDAFVAKISDILPPTTTTTTLPPTTTTTTLPPTTTTTTLPPTTTTTTLPPTTTTTTLPPTTTTTTLPPTTTTT
ncbi:MAG: SBBP repeat-containing protein, partial [Pseudonocardiaceae bacterium]